MGQIGPEILSISTVRPVSKYAPEVKGLGPEMNHFQQPHFWDCPCKTLTPYNAETLHQFSKPRRVAKGSISSRVG